MNCNKNQVLPKIWLQKFPKRWCKCEKDMYVETTSTFSSVFESEEIKIAVLNMEEKLGTSESIITEDMIPENKMLDSYLGTYDVEGETGKLTVIFPERVPSGSVGVIAMHYNSETQTWEKVEDAQIIDGFVYGTLESFSPISVFVLRKDTTFIENDKYFQGPIFVANGIPVVVSVNNNGETVVTDANGKVTIINPEVYIIGGTIDGSDVDSTSVVVSNATIKGVYAGSLSLEEDVISVANECKVEIINSTITRGISGTLYNNKINSLSINMKDSSAMFVGAGYCGNKLNGKDSNTDSKMDLSAKSLVKNVVMNLTNTNVEILYTAGTSGLLYVDHTELNINGGKCDYITCAGSNGRTKECIANIKNVNAVSIQSTNRGTVGSVKLSVKDCVVERLAVAGDPEAKDVNGSIENVKVDITGGTINLYAGTNNGEELTNKNVRDIVEYVKVSRSTNIEYKNNSKSVLGDLIKIK